MNNQEEKISFVGKALQKCSVVDSIPPPAKAGSTQAVEEIKAFLFNMPRATIMRLDFEDYKTTQRAGHRINHVIKTYFNSEEYSSYERTNKKENRFNLFIQRK